MAGAALGAPPERSAEVRRQVSTMDAGCFCVACAALGAPQARFACQAHITIYKPPPTQYHLHHLHYIINTKPSTLHHQTQHHQHTHHLHYIISATSSTQPHQHVTIYTTPQHHLHNTIHTTPSTLHHQHHTIYTTSSNTTSSTHTIYITSSTQHHQHNLINTSPSTQHHNTIYTTPSTQHHLHYIIKHWQVQHLEPCHIAPSAPFLLIPLLLFFVVDCSLFSFIDLFHSWMSEDTVNMWGYPVLKLSF